LNRRLAGLQYAEDKEHELREARLHQESLKGSLQTLQAQLDEIPPEHRRAVAEVQSEHDQAEAEVSRVGEELREGKEELFRLQEQKRVADGRREEFAEAEKEFGYFRRLYEAFGPSGLRVRVIRAAQETISSHANTILSHLSNGEWQVELRDLSDDELEIQARNVAQPGAQPRPFEYLSGGEKFRVAVSLAVAIGQSVLGERVVDTLVIDEGFGSLDETNRDLMAKEMSRLSQEVLGGGRVVVVSHLDDVRDDFGSRYRISKDTAGYVQVERSS
jgi:DNA repair exonuclease SbcCD ATPase subunit